MDVLRLPGIVVLLVALCFLAGPPLADACSMPVGWRPKSDVELVYEAGMVLYVRMRARYDNGGSWNTLYTAGVEVRCILKGQQTNRFLNLTNVGIAPGLCTDTGMDVGADYFVLYHSNSVGSMPGRTILATPDKVEEIVQTCGLQPTDPVSSPGLLRRLRQETSAGCPRTPPPGQCVVPEIPDDTNNLLEIDLPSYPGRTK